MGTKSGDRASTLEYCASCKDIIRIGSRVHVYGVIRLGWKPYTSQGQILRDFLPGVRLVALIPREQNCTF